MEENKLITEQMDKYADSYDNECFAPQFMDEGAELFQHYNPNPRGLKVGDCVIRAISKALGVGWEDTYLNLCIEGYMSSDLPSSNFIWDRFLLKNGFRRGVLPNSCPACYTIHDFCAEHPKGIFILGTGTHAVAVIDGMYYDAWDSGKERPIYFYYKGE